MLRKSLVALAAGALLIGAGSFDSAQAQYRWRMPPGGGYHGHWGGGGWGHGGWGGGWGHGGSGGGWGAFGAGALLGAATSLIAAPAWGGGYGYDFGYAPGYAAYPAYPAYPAYGDPYVAAPVAYEPAPVVYRTTVVRPRRVVYRTRYVAPARFYAAGPVYRRAAYWGGYGPRRHYASQRVVVRTGYGAGGWRHHRRVMY
jgi:hypothetical protein